MMMRNKEGEEEDNNSNGNTSLTTHTAKSLKKVRLLLVPNSVGHIAQKKGCSNSGVLVVLEPTFKALLHAARHKVHHKFAAAQKSSKKNHKQQQNKQQKQKQTPRFFFKDGRELLPSPSGGSMASVLKDDTVIVVSLTGEGFAAYPGGARMLEEEEEKGRDAIVSQLIAAHSLDNLPLSDHYATEESRGISLDNDQEDNDLITQPPSLLEENGDSPSSSSSSVGCCEGKKGTTEPGRSEGEELSTHSSLQPLLQAAAALPPFTKKMAPTPTQGLEFCGPFPILEGNVIPLLREAIDGCDDFVVTNCGDYLAFDYKRVTKNTFPDPTQLSKKHHRQRWLLAARRECRGLLVSRVTGLVLARRFHKFFNVDERPEASASSIDFSAINNGTNTDSVLLLEKLDGCLVSPLLLVPPPSPTMTTLLRETEAAGTKGPMIQVAPRLLWATKSQHVKQLEDYVAAMANSSHSPSDYRGLALEWISSGFTPLLEWCYGSVGGVIHHQQQSLVLLAIRHNVRGDYLPWNSLQATAIKYNVPLAPRISLDLQKTPTMESLIAEVNMWKPGKEGLVMFFGETGRMFKLKSHWYRTLHSNSGISNLAKVLDERPSLDGVPLGMVWTAVVSEKVDDVLPLLRAANNFEDAEKLMDFVVAYESRKKALRNKLAEWGIKVKQAVQDLSADHLQSIGTEKAEEAVLQKLLSTQVSYQQHLNRKALLQCFVKPMGIDAQETAIQQEVRSLAGKKKWPQLEALLDLSWEKHFLNTNGAPRAIMLNETEGDQEKEDQDAVHTMICSSSVAVACSQLQIYCDLDGVLADFEAGLRTIAPNATIPEDSAEMWALVRKHKNFWRNLRLLEGAEQLWSFLQSRPSDSSPPKVLTGVPAGKMGELAKKQKQIWCHKHLSQEVEVIACQSSRKFEYSGFGRVLIDDRESLREEWERMGGAFILHTDVSTTCSKLRTMLPEMKDQLEAVKSLLQAAEIVKKEQPDKIYAVPEEGIVLVAGDSGLSEFIEAMDSAEVVGLDVEWPPDDLIGNTGHNLASLLQIAISNQKVFLVDMTNLHPTAKPAIIQLLETPRILKLAFGLQADIQRLGLDCSRIENVLDLAQIIPVLVRFPIGTAPSLAKVVESFLGVRLLKNKILQTFDWSVRPLSLTHQQYAACDAACLLSVYSALVQKPSLKRALLKFNTKLDVLSSFSKKPQQLAARATNRAKQRVTLQYSAVFLTPHSRQQLLAYIPAQFGTVYADHVTLTYAPKLHEIRDLPVGKAVQVRVLGLAKDEHVQAVAVQLVDNNLPTTNTINHVTISTRQGVKPSQSNTLMSNGYTPLNLPEGQSLLLDGIVGLMVANEFVAAELPPKILKEIEEFASTGQPGQYLELGLKQPLTAMERQAVHKYAEEHGLESKSSGQKQHRIVTLRIPQRSRTKGEGLQEKGTAHELRIMKSGNEEENRRMMKRQAKSRAGTSCAFKPQLIEVRDETTLKSLQLVFKSMSDDHEKQGEDESSTASTVDVHGRVLGDSRVQLCCAKNSKHALLSTLLEGSPKTLGNDTKLVIVMRGLPGSGKSSIISALKRIVMDDIAICSADEFWERGAGLSKRELKRLRSEGSEQADDIYALCFNEKRLSEAHNYCRSLFYEAIAAKKSLVVVDNVNALERDYADYLAAASKEGYSTSVVEIICPGNSEMTTFHNRCRHRIPMKTMAGMWSRWEADLDALLLAPYLGDDTTVLEQSALAPIDHDSQSLMQWLTHHKFFGVSKHRTPTHMITQLEGRSVKFLHVPSDYHEEFLRRFAEDKSPQYIVEFCTPVFRMYFDLDYIGKQEMTKDQLLKAVRALQRTVQELYPGLSPHILTAAVTWGDPYQHSDDEIKSGRHIIFPHLFVTVQQAKFIRSVAVAHLISMLGEDLSVHRPWDEMLDNAVYMGPSPGLRLLGSRKTKNVGGGKYYVDVGCVHKLQALINERGEFDPGALAPFSRDLTAALIQMGSIRSHSATPTPGFKATNISSHENAEASGALHLPKSALKPTIKRVELDDVHFKKAKQQLVDHVLEKYIPRKLAQYLGLPLKSLTDETIIRIPSKHEGSEGKIHGMWEQFVKSDGILDLRVDLQPPRREGRTSHYGDAAYANWQIQFGPSKVCKSSSRARPGLTEAGAFAGILMRTDTDFRVADFKRAMALSFCSMMYVYLDVPTTTDSPPTEEEYNEGASASAPQDDDYEEEEEEEKEESSSIEDDSEGESEETDEDEEDDGEEEEEKETKKNQRDQQRKLQKHNRKAKYLDKQRWRGE